jgi:hypothetical protein
MIDLGVAFAWIVMSIASAKGLAALARAAASADAETELASLAQDGGPAYDERSLDAWPRLLRQASASSLATPAMQPATSPVAAASGGTSIHADTTSA